MKEITAESLRQILKSREKRSHKHQYGHLLIVAGCDRMPGAAIMATGAALKSGCGLVTLYSSPRVTAMAVARHPSAMCADADEPIETLLDNIDRYSVYAMGPGLGKKGGITVAVLLREAAFRNVPVVLDADALNALALRPDLFESIPTGSVLTPHEGELQRLLAGRSLAEFVSVCNAKGITLVRKGYRTEVYTPDGEVHVNTTGNPGMAKGGSGDVLTGLIGGLMARGYTGSEAARLGVWIHGYAGDILSERCTQEAYCAEDLVDELYQGFKALYALD